MPTVQVERMKRDARIRPASLVLSHAKVDSAFYTTNGAMGLLIAQTNADEDDCPKMCDFGKIFFH
jgi:hypothetical protein